MYEYRRNQPRLSGEMFHAKATNGVFQMKYLIAAILVSVSIVEAQSPALLSVDGRPTTVSVAAGAATKRTFYSVIKGNSSAMVRLALTAPTATKVKASTIKITGTVAQALATKKGFTSLQVLTESQAASFNASPCIDFSPGEGSAEPEASIPQPESSSPLCDLFPPDARAAIGEALAALYGGSWSDAQVCGYLVNNYFGGAEPCDPVDPLCALLQSLEQSQPQAARYSPAIATTYQSFTVRVSQDACAPKSTRYLVKFELSIPARNESLTITARATSNIFSGAKAASIKPVSDGKFAPQPILLMSFLGNLCGQRLELSKWSAAKRISKSTTEPKDLIPYNGRVLTRTPIGSFLTGGKGTFELFNGRTNYGVCFELRKRRQKVNGY